MIQINVGKGNQTRLRTVFGVLAANGFNWKPARERGRNLLDYALTQNALRDVTERPMQIFADEPTRTIYLSTGGPPTRSIRAQGGMNTLSDLLEAPVLPSVQLTDAYAAVVGSNYVAVGCQKIPHSKVLEVADAIRKQ